MPVNATRHSQVRRASDKLKRRSLFWSAVGLGMLLIMASIALWTARQVTDSDFWVAHTREVISVAQQFFADLKDAESAQRAYLITGQDEYLESYEAAANQVPNDVSTLKRLTADNPVQQERLDVLQPLVTRRLGELQERVRLRRESGFQAAERALMGGQSQELMDQILYRQKQIEHLEDQLLVDRSHTRQARIRQGFTGTVMAALLAVIALIVAPLDVRRAVAQREMARRELQESESTAHSLFEAASQGILIVDQRGQIVMANPATERMFGYQLDELRGQPVEALLPERLRTGHEAHRENYFAHPQTRPMGLGLDLQARRKDGSEFFAEISLSYIQTARGTLAVAFVTDISKRRSDEQELRQQRADLQRLAARMMTAQEDERRHIARNLHDDLSQTLAFLAIDTGKLAAQSPESVARQLRPLQRRAVEAAETVRQISHELHPSILDDLGLTAALEQYCEEFQERSGIATHFVSQNVPEYLPEDVSSCIYRVAQESLRNVSKHSKTETVFVRLEMVDSAVRLTVKDLGVGLARNASESRTSIGIVGMKERARLVNGNLSLQSRFGEGTEVSLEVPVVEAS
jgi:PAS domain S-box-containing protein